MRRHVHTPGVFANLERLLNAGPSVRISNTVERNERRGRGKRKQP